MNWRYFFKKTPKKQYELWGEDTFNYQDIERYRIAVYTDWQEAEAELQKRRQEAGGEKGIMNYWIWEREIEN
ncbi:MAG: hypothetical protein LBT76_01025 [Tannerella sp.]|jgi:hypothetical protein|nr:hypothetical protein [Tannerella sp.]